MNFNAMKNGIGNGQRWTRSLWARFRGKVRRQGQREILTRDIGPELEVELDFNPNDECKSAVDWERGNAPGDSGGSGR